MGQTALTQLNQGGENFAAQAGQAVEGAGNALASGIVGSANAINSGITGAAGAVSNSLLLNPVLKQLLSLQQQNGSGYKNPPAGGIYDANGNYVGE